MPYEDAGDAYMNHAGGGFYETGRKETLDDKVGRRYMSHAGADRQYPDAPKSSQPGNIPPLELEKPTEKQKAVVSNWWFDKRDRIAVMFDVAPEDVPANVVWFLDIDYVATQRDIDRARQIAKELGLLNEQEND
jgi:hypothetical protein